MGASLSRADKLQLIALLEEKQRRAAKSQPIGFVDPHSGRVSTIKRSGEAWEQTTDEALYLLPAKFERAVTTKKRYKILIGGRGSAKSMSVADICLLDGQHSKLKTGCFREYQNSIDDSVYSLLGAEIDRLGLSGFKSLANSIEYEGEEIFKFRGLARNTESIKSMHGFKRFWNEEAQTLSYKSLKDQTPTLREEDSELWMTGNPRSAADPFSQRFIKPFEKRLRADGYYEDDMHLIIVMNYTDNPFFPKVLEEERAYDEKAMSAALYRHVWLGDMYDEVQGSIIPVEWFDAAIDAHEVLGFKGEGAIVCAFDPSDIGDDAKGLAIRKGSIVLDVDEKDDGDSAEGMDWALERARSVGADLFVWDCDGLGVSLKRQVDKELGSGRTDFYMFKGSETPDNPDMPYGSDLKVQKSNRDTFANKRAQYWWMLRDRFEATYRAVKNRDWVNPDNLISLSSSIKKLDQLRAEVCRIPEKRNNNGRIQIMSKIDMAKPPYSLPSPNMGDALMMSLVTPERSQPVVALNFRGWGR
jgi:phage terminase large subunit